MDRGLISFGHSPIGEILSTESGDLARVQTLNIMFNYIYTRGFGGNPRRRHDTAARLTAPRIQREHPLQTIIYIIIIVIITGDTPRAVGKFDECSNFPVCLCEISSILYAICGAMANDEPQTILPSRVHTHTHTHT